MSKTFHYKLTIYNLEFVLKDIYPYMKKISNTNFMLHKMVIEETPNLPDSTLCEIFFSISGTFEEMQPHIDYIESVLDNKSFDSCINIMNLKDHVQNPKIKWTEKSNEDQCDSLRYNLEYIFTEINHIPFNKRFFYPLSSYMADIE